MNIEFRLLPHSRNRPIWTLAAIECYQLSGECGQCRIHKLTGLSWDSKKKPCNMPYAVAKLLDRKGEPINANVAGY